MVRGAEGWERSRDGVFWTGDGGRRWRQITPPMKNPVKVRGVYFVDPRHGWALAEPGHEGAARPTVFTTVDGGHSWTHARLPLSERIRGATSASFATVGRHRMFLLFRGAGDTATNIGTLLESTNGGRHWRALPDPPQAGQISFESALDGWLVGGFPGPHLWRTNDGGNSWREVRLAGLPPSGNPWISYLPPRIGPAGSGILLTFWPSQRGKPSRAIVYATGDRGASWRPVSTVRLPKVAGPLEGDEALSFRGRGRSVLVHAPVSGSWTVVSPDGRGGPLRPSHGLPRWSQISLSDADHGFAWSPYIHPPQFAVTSDGGRHWSPVRPAHSGFPLGG